VLKSEGAKGDWSTSSHCSSKPIIVSDWQAMYDYVFYSEPLLSYKLLQPEEQ